MQTGTSAEWKPNTGLSVESKASRSNRLGTLALDHPGTLSSTFSTKYLLVITGRPLCYLQIPSENKPFLRITITTLHGYATCKTSTINRQLALEHPLSAAHITYQCPCVTQGGPDTWILYTDPRSAPNGTWSLRAIQGNNHAPKLPDKASQSTSPTPVPHSTKHCSYERCSGEVVLYGTLSD